MYGCAKRTLTKYMLLTLRLAQRRMLRFIVNTSRRRQRQPHASTDENTTNPDTEQHDDGTSDDSKSTVRQHLDFDDVDDESDLESWDSFIRRATHAASDLATRAHVEEWVTIFHKRKWRWAGRVATQPHHSWARLAAAWEPDIHDPRAARRRHGGQRKRWSDDITEFLQKALVGSTPDTWLQSATNSKFWADLENDFLKFTCL